MRIAIAIAFPVLVSICAPALAAQHSGNEFICQNPHRKYMVRVQPAARQFITSAEDGITRYKVRSIRTIPGGFEIGGDTVAGGPPFVGHFGTDGNWIKFYLPGEVQTDPCHP